MSKKSATELVKEAKLKIKNLTPEQVEEQLLAEKAILIDIREREELERDGRIAGSIHVPRGILEFCADSSLLQYKPEFDGDKIIILHCASGSRSALATVTLKQMGYKNLAHLEGGIKAWKNSGKQVVE